MSKISTRDLKKMIRNSRRFRLTYILGYIFIAIGVILMIISIMDDSNNLIDLVVPGAFTLLFIFLVLVVDVIATNVYKRMLQEKGLQAVKRSLSLYIAESMKNAGNTNNDNDRKTNSSNAVSSDELAQLRRKEMQQKGSENESEKRSSGKIVQDRNDDNSYRTMSETEKTLVSLAAGYAMTKTAQKVVNDSGFAKRRAPQSYPFSYSKVCATCEFWGGERTIEERATRSYYACVDDYLKDGRCSQCSKFKKPGNGCEKWVKWSKCRY